MIFLDANAFYSYYGRSKLGMTSEPVDEERLKKYLEQQREKSLPTSVYIEIMTHFRNNPKVLQNLLEFRYAKGLPLFNNIPDYVVSEDEITSVAYMDQAALKNYADRLLKSKIQIESKFTLLFFEITKDLYAHYKLEMTDGLSQKNKDAILGYIGRVAYKEYQNLLEERIKVELQSGYDENKEKKVLKDFYIQELNEACVLTNIIIQGCVACKQDKEDIISIVQQTYQKSIESGLDGNTGTMPCIVDTLATDQHFLDIAKVKVSEMFKKGKYSATQRRYLRDVMFTSWFERGKKLDKNDIFDMLCVGCLDHIDKTKNACVLIDASSYVLSFDTRMKNFIGTVKPENLRLIEKIQNDYNRHYSETQKAYQAKIDFQESELNLYKNLASLGMLTGSFGHETSDIVSRIQTSLLLVNLYLDNGMDINQIKDVVSIVSGDFDRIYAYSNLIVNFLRKRKRTIDSEINLSSALKEVGGFYQTIVKSFDITLNFVCEDTIEYKIKQIDFESIVINMITNAFEQVKGRENRKITVTISQSASHLIIYFEDSGTGVPEGKEKEIFRPFETTKENGIGLGLNIVKDIVEKYHGDISVKRSETMLGAKFIVTLPKGDE